MKKNSSLSFTSIIKVIGICYKVSPNYLIKIFVTDVLCGIIPIISLAFWQKFIDDVNSMIVLCDNKSLNNVIVLLVFYCCIALTDRLLERVNDFYLKNEVDNIEHYFTKLIFEQIQYLSVEDFENPNIYNKIKIALDNSSSSVLSILSNIMKILKSIIMTIGYAILLLPYMWLALLVCILGSVPSFIISLKIMKDYYLIYTKRCEELRHIDYIKRLIINSENIKEVKIYNYDEFFRDYISVKQKIFNTENAMMRKRHLRYVTEAQIFDMIWIMIAKILVLIKVFNINSTIGKLTIFLNSIQQFGNCLSMMFEIISELYNSNLYVDEFYSLIKIAEEKKKCSGTDKVDRFRSLEFKNVSYRYPDCDENIFEHVNLKIEKGKTYSVVGENGAGKTTLLRMMLGLYTEDSGNILLNGMNIKNFDKKGYSEQIGVMFQNYMKLPLTVKANIELGQWEKYHDDNEIEDAAELSGINKYIQGLPHGYSTKLYKEWSDGTDLSVGQWQKLALARSFLGNKEILFLDEPSSSFDEESEEIFFNRLLKSNKTIICVVHNMKYARMMDKIIFIKDKKIEIFNADEFTKKY